MVFRIADSSSTFLLLKSDPTPILDVSGELAVTGDLRQGSSRELKQDLEPVAADAILSALADLPLYRWRYKSDAETTHLGPMAEDLYQRFGLGRDERHISPADAAGLALAALQALHGQFRDATQELTEANSRLAAENARLAERLSAIERLLEVDLPVGRGSGERAE